MYQVGIISLQFTVVFYNVMSADINECLPDAIGNTTCHHICTNSPGTYHCECHTGFRLQQDLFNCSGMSVPSIPLAAG